MSTLTHDQVRPVKPLLRGISHQVMVVVASAAATAIVVAYRDTRAVIPALIYGLSLVAMFGASALYHRTNPPPRVEKWLERMDHAAIFLFISGTYTPFCYLLGEWGQTLLVIAWGSTVLGVARALFWIDAPRWVSVAQYLIAGWTILPFIGDLWRAAGPTAVALLAAGGLMYSLGAVVFARGRPNPYPRVFGFHEIFHAFVVAAAICHFIAVLIVLPKIA